MLLPFRHLQLLRFPRQAFFLDKQSESSTVIVRFGSYMAGGGDFERMQAVAKVGTLIYYWSLVVLGVMIGMNIIITILYAQPHSHLIE